MKLFKLSRFETQTFSTHTIFIATSLEQARHLCGKFYDEYFEKAQEYRIALKKRDEYYKSNKEYGNIYELYPILFEIEGQRLHEYVFEIFDFYDNSYEDGSTRLTKEELIDGWMKDIYDFESDSLLFHSQIDGD